MIDPIEVLRAADPRFGPVADTLLELADDDTVSPAVYDRVCQAVFTVLDAWADRPHFGDPIDEPQVVGLAVAFKALVLRAGGKVELTNPELEHAKTVLMSVLATAELMTVEVVEGGGPAPDQPRYDADWKEGDVEA